VPGNVVMVGQDGSTKGGPVAASYADQETEDDKLKNGSKTRMGLTQSC
jgi:hypothetical protein